MDIPQDPRDLKCWVLKVLQDYGEELLVFGPEDQPNVFAHPEPPLRKLKSGNVGPQRLKSWRYLDLTVRFLIKTQLQTWNRPPCDYGDLDPPKFDAIVSVTDKQSL